MYFGSLVLVYTIELKHLFPLVHIQTDSHKCNSSNVQWIGGGSHRESVHMDLERGF